VSTLTERSKQGKGSRTRKATAILSRRDIWAVLVETGFHSISILKEEMSREIFYGRENWNGR